MIVRVLVWVIDHMTLSQKRELHRRLIDLLETARYDGKGAHNGVE